MLSTGSSCSAYLCRSSTLHARYSSLRWAEAHMYTLIASIPELIRWWSNLTEASTLGVNG